VQCLDRGHNAIEFLRLKVVQHFVMVESNARGDAYVYRSPDALFINGELLSGAQPLEALTRVIERELARGR